MVFVEGGSEEKFFVVPTTDIFSDLYRFFTRARTKGSQGFDPKGGILLCTILTHDTLRPSPTILRPCSDHSQVLRTTANYLFVHISFYSNTSIRRSGPHPLRISSDHAYCLLVTFTFPFVVTLHSNDLGTHPSSDLTRPRTFFYCLVPYRSLISVRPTTSGT